MDWLAFTEKKRTELSNTGQIMDNETFITHLLNSLPQAEYEAAILVSKDKLRKGAVHLPEIEQILEDKYSSMKNVKSWDEKEDDYALSTSHSNKKSHKKQFKGQCGYCGGYGHKAADCPKNTNSQSKGSKRKSDQKKKHSTKGENNGKGQKYMSITICYNCREYGHFAHDCLKPCNNANIGQEHEQNKGFKNMLDLDSSSK